MSELLATKLHAPRPRPDAVVRARLLDRLGRDGATRLILVSAPPGFGKTTLVAQWLATLGATTRTAWVSLETLDDQPATFWRYVVAAIGRAADGIGDGALALLDDPQAGTERVVGTLLNELDGLQHDLVVVLDDFHAIEDRDISAGVAFLLDHLPGRVRVVILTRADPPLPLPRMRVRGELIEVRAADLRFTADESAAYLNEGMGLGLDEPEVDVLEARTEGWIAALQLAAISLQGRSDTTSFIEAFSGDDRLVVDYLADEVLERQPEAVREFLLRTAILDRLTGALCDAVTGNGGGAAMLEALERANLFLVPLDDRRRWYRYHHLFADLLRTRLLDQHPDVVPDLHRRASAWWQAEGEASEAISHALAAGDAERAADLIEVEARTLRRTRQEVMLCRWLDSLPDPLFEARPVLALAHAGALLSTGQTRSVEARLQAAERWAGAADGDEGRMAAEAAGMIVRHTEAVGHIPSAVALYRAALARMAGDVPGTIAQARAALDAASADQPLERGAAAGLLALALWANGDLDAAHASWSDAVSDLDRAAHHADMLGGYLSMGDIRATQGRLGDAQRTYERGLRVGAGMAPPLRGTADMHVGIAEVLLARDDVAGAARELAAAAALGEGGGLPQNPYRTRIAQAGLRAAQGELDAALALADEAEQVYVADFFPDVRPVGAIRASLWTRLGRHAEALAWAADRSLTADDEPSYLREEELTTLAEALIERGRAGARTDDAATALRLLDRLLAAAEEGGRMRSVIRLLVARAGALDMLGRNAEAAASLDRALVLAEPEHHARVFLDVGRPIRRQLLEAAGRGVVPAFASLLAATGGTGPAGETHPAHGSGAVRVPGPAPAGGRSMLVEPLSERELEVLRLLASDLDGPSIADALYISVNTLRTHTRNIFAKLGVNSRRAAVTRAIELGLLRGSG